MSNLISLKGKTALVCGSTQGIGKAIALLFAAQGARVYLMARNEQALKDLCDLHENLAGYIVADFQNNDSVKNGLLHFKEINNIDILVNNTGGPPAGLISTASTEQFLAAFQLHLINNHILVQAVLPSMIEKKSGGRIINIISTSVKVPMPNLGVSNTIRASVGAWAKTLANEVAKHGITVNNILPGATSTGRLASIIETKAKNNKVAIDKIEAEMIHEIPMGRFAEPIEIANAVLFLASEAASYITGINLPVDGGRTPCL